MSEYYDRRAFTVAKDVNTTTGAAARGATVDWTYTCPTGRRAKLEFALARCESLTATATNADAAAIIRVQPNGSPNFGVVLQASIQSGALAGASGAAGVTLAVAGSFVLQPGDVLYGVSLSSNTAAGSNVAVQTSVVLTEFDA